MTELTKTDEQGATWYPVSIARLEGLLEKIVCSNQGYDHSNALRKNLAYNLQYIEFQDRVLQDIKLSSVLHTQTIKTIILVGSGVIESLLNYLLIINNLHSTTEWKEKCKFKGNQKKLDDEYVRLDSVLYEKLPSKEFQHMTFDGIIKCAKSNNILGSGKVVYDKLNSMRRLRNKVHLQVINNPGDTDWNSFNNADLSDMSKILYAVFTSSLFSPSADERAFFHYLRRSINA